MEKGGGSRLLQMQARFQQKQMQERELKIASLYEAQQARALDRVRHSPSNGVSITATSPTQPVPHQPGKVRSEDTACNKLTTILYEEQQEQEQSTLERVQHSSSSDVIAAVEVTSPTQPVSDLPEKVRREETACNKQTTTLQEISQEHALDRVRHSPSNGVSVTAEAKTSKRPSSPKSRKVRQMFEERRTKAGIDKSYPLQPIHNTEKATRKPLPNGYTKVTSSTTSTRVEKKSSSIKSHTTVTTHSIKKQQKIDNIVNGSGDLNHNHKPDLHPIKQQLPQSNGEVIPSTDETDKPETKELLEDETFPEALEPSPTPRTPEPITEVVQPKRSTPIKTTSPTKTKSQQSVTSPPRRTTNGTNPSTAYTRHLMVSDSNRARGAMQKAANPVPKKPPVKSSGPPTPSTPKARAATASTTPSSGGSGAACTICGRYFAPDRVAKHQEICKKSHTKKRKPFDALKHRLAGTEAEPFISKLRKSTTTPSSTKVSAKPLNNNWRQKHEEFIQAIRAAKQVQAHLSAGGKLSDLPPPPPSENPDYVQCPHCNRRFNQGAAERHIPKCANYQFNKPKPAARRR